MVNYGKISFAWYPLHEIMVPKNPDLTTGQKNGMHRTGYGFIHGYPMATKVCRSAQNHWLSHVFFLQLCGWFIWHPLQRILSWGSFPEWTTLCNFQAHLLSIEFRRIWSDSCERALRKKRSGCSKCMQMSRQSLNRFKNREWTHFQE